MNHLLEREQFFPHPIEQVFAFFSDPRNLEAITPPWLSFRIVTPVPTCMERGSIIEYELRWRLIRLRWRTEITVWDPPHQFCDEQVSGPYKLWRHTHSFTSEPGGVRMADRVEYKLPLGFLGAIAHAVRVRRDLERIFDFRESAIAGALSERFGGNPGPA